MTVSYRLQQICDVARAVAVSCRLAMHDHWTRDHVLREQQRRLRALLRYAMAHSDFYRTLYRGIPLDGDIRLADLPTIDKRVMMANFDRIVTDTRLRRTDLEAHLAGLTQDAYHLGEYRVLTTAGTSGLRGMFVFNRREWSIELANALRWHRFMRVRPGPLKRVKISALGADRPLHVSARLTESADVGIFKFQRLPVTVPLADLVGALNAFQPEVLLCYPSVAALLALEQSAGRLAIRPRVVSTHSERLTGEMASRIERAWATRPFDHYGLTEISTVAAECAQHRGLHLLDDLFIAEVVDDAYRPVAPGVMGTRLLLTNLYNFSQPLIRYEVSDMLALSDESCPCARPFPLIAQIGGRSEETLWLEGLSGGAVAVPSVVVCELLEEFSELAEFQIHRVEGTVKVEAVLRADAPPQPDLEQRLAGHMERGLRAMGAKPPPIQILLRRRFERTGVHMGKFKLVHVAQERPGAPLSA